MKKTVRIICFILGAVLCEIIWVLPIQGLPEQGKQCLGLSLMIVVWWAGQVAQPGYVSGIYLALLCLLRVADPAVVFSGWTSSVLWLIPGAYLMAAAVQKSGLGERLSYFLIRRFVRGWISIIGMIFALTFALSLLIPHPWPRAFLIMSVMSVVIRAANLPQKDAVAIGFSVFAAQVPISLIFLTGDASVNFLAASYAVELSSFWGWFRVMGLPASLLSLLTLVIILTLFRPSVPVSIDMEQVRWAQRRLGKMSQTEVRVLLWVGLAVVLWMTNSLTGLDIGWTTLLISMLMSMPVVGEVLGSEDWEHVPVHVMVFMTAAIAIGRVGEETGMNQWLGSTLLPAYLPGNIVFAGLLIAALSVAIHMCMGSLIAVMGIVIPTFLAFAQRTGIPELVVIAVAYISLAGHYLLPFHHLSILVGEGEKGGMYTQSETIKMSAPLLGALLITVMAALGWWELIGLI